MTAQIGLRGGSEAWLIDVTGEQVQTEFHKIWQEQCEAAEEIKERYGLENALAYLIGEKLINFSEAAEQHPEFAQDHPRLPQRFDNSLAFKKFGTTSTLWNSPKFSTMKVMRRAIIDEGVFNDHTREQERRQRVAWVKAMILGLGC